VRLPRNAWPNALALFIRETILPSARARGLRGRVAVFEVQDGRRGEFLIVLTIASETAVGVKLRGRR
jgi:hypothetical protein